MTYDHAVKVNGRWYKAGENIPALSAIKEPIVDKVANDEVVAEPTTTVKKSYKKGK